MKRKARARARALVVGAGEDQWRGFVLVWYGAVWILGVEAPWWWPRWWRRPTGGAMSGLAEEGRGGRRRRLRVQKGEEAGDSARDGRYAERSGSCRRAEIF
jgi:hypothetical protein